MGMNAIKFGVAVAALAGATCIWLMGRTSTDDRLGKFFYDLSEQKLYAEPRGSFAPLEGIGGESGDGVEAIIVGCPQCGEDKHRIAYLKSHTPEYKQKREEAKSAGRQIEGLTRPWIAQQTLVRRLDGSEWHTADSDEAAEILRGWRRRCDEHEDWERSQRP